jgi:hypothetical protein
MTKGIVKGKYIKNQVEKKLLIEIDDLPDVYIGEEIEIIINKLNKSIQTQPIK